MKKKISIILGAVFSAVFLFLAMRNVDFQVMAAVFSRMNAALFLVILGVFTINLFIRGLRWKLLLDPAGKLKISLVFRLETIGFALNNVLPLRLGEVGRATLGAGLTGIPFLTFLATVFVERILDILSLSIIFMIASASGALPWTRDYGKLFWTLAAVLFTGLIFLIFLDELLAKNRAVSSALARFPRLERVVRQLALGAEALRDWKKALAIIACGFALWLVDAANYWLASRTVNISHMLSYGQSVLVSCLSALAVAMPSVPGYFGTYEYAVAKVLSVWGIPHTEGFAFAGFLHITGYVLITVLGVIFLYQAGQSLTGVWKSLKERR
ncbi:MAG: lysylphosphatidylglycerol synthase transmembrane domain-containing protein [bacterium]